MSQSPLRSAVIVGASGTVLVAMILLLVWGTDSVDLTMLEVASVPLMAIALDTLLPSEVRTEQAAETETEPETEPASPTPEPVLDGPGDADPVPFEVTAPELGFEEPAALSPPPSRGGLPEVRQGPVTISGVVTLRSGAGIAGASVTAVDRAGRQVALARTDPSGHFEIHGLGGGSYLTVFLALPYRPATRAVSLAAGWAIVDVTLRGRGTVHARILGGQRRRPQAGVPVALARPDGTIERTTVTDWAGRYLFDAVDEGEWLLLSGAPRHLDGQQGVVVRAGESAGEDLVLTALGEVSGEIADAGDPIPGVRVVLLDEGGDIVGVARTNRAGTYRFAEVAEGTYVVAALMLQPRTSVVVVRADAVEFTLTSS